MKIFIDTANLDQIKKAHELGIVDGVTTNPTLMNKESGKSAEDIVLSIVNLVQGPVSVEVIGRTAEEMTKEARKWFAMNPEHIVIKIPMCTEGLKAISMLHEENIPCNCTLIFSVNQGLLAAKAGARYVSPFVGRLDDIGHDGMKLVEELVDCIDYYEFDTEIIAASIRHPLHAKQAALVGAHIATIPLQVIEKMIQHPLTKKGIEDFEKDWAEFKKTSK
ncbi:MAG: fructose-6-phosphate aldolase [Caldisericia bacterium]|nr:fructose-6-phosphate aldolase [Caldisericia bacterium]